ncbi:hypothetical protein [Neobacillus sp. NPDC093127]|uniref:hypothetical protein n=1 Tax=Neobacillus sp. NPDC093127 TaxID=3364296 RepID=UPI0037F43D25
MENIAKVAAETAVKVAFDYLEEEKKKEQKVRRDRRIRNTKLLLRNYRSFVSHCKNVEAELELSDDELIVELDVDELAVEAIKRSKRRTLAMVKFIDKMLRVYEIISAESGRQEEIRQCQTIYQLYIGQDKLTVEDIAKCHNVVTRTVHRDIKEAVKALTSLVFGVDGIRFID